MSKPIKSFSFYAPDMSGKRENKTFRIYFESHEDRFYMVAPDHLCDRMPNYSQEKVGDGPVTTIRESDGKIYGRTPVEVEKKFESNCYKYERSVATCRKVIAYKLSFKSGNRDDYDGLTFEPGIGLMVDWQIGHEIKTGSASKARIWRYNPLATTGVICNNQTVGGDKYKVIDWTEDREAFFVSLDDSLKKMVAKARKFLGNEKKLIAAIDSKSMPFLLEDKS